MPYQRGSEHHQAKLTDEDVRLIRQIHADAQRQIEHLRATCSYRALARKFEVSPRTISAVLSYERWRHADDAA